jgi:hypothetical protein
MKLLIVTFVSCRMFSISLFAVFHVKNLATCDTNCIVLTEFKFSFCRKSFTWAWWNGDF